MGIDKSSRHQKIIGEFSEYLVLNWLSRSGWEAARVDHTGIDIVAYHPSSKQRIGISVKSRTRVPPLENESVTLSLGWDKIEAACLAFNAEPWLAIYVETLKGPDLCSNDPTRKLVRQMFGAIAEYEKTMLVLKLRAARERKRAEGGKAVGRYPYGFILHEKKIIERIRAMRRTRKNGTPGMKLREIAERLNSEGERSKDGGLWTEIKVHNVLNGGKKTKRGTYRKKDGLS